MQNKSTTSEIGEFCDVIFANENLSFLFINKTNLTLLAPEWGEGGGGGGTYQEPVFFCIIFEALMVLSPNFVTFPVFILVNNKIQEAFCLTYLNFFLQKNFYNF